MAVRKYGDGLRCAKAGNEAKDRVKRRKQTGRDHMCAPRLSISGEKSQEQRPKALKTEVEGDGRTRSSAYFYSMRNGTKRCSAGRTDILLGRETSGG